MSRRWVDYDQLQQGDLVLDHRHGQALVEQIPPGRCGANLAASPGLSCELLAGHAGMHQARQYPAGELSAGRLAYWQQAHDPDLAEAYTVTSAPTRTFIRKSEQIIADLQAALDELRGWAPGPLDVPCRSCGAKTGEPCRTPNGDEMDAIHATRGAPS